MKPGGGGGGNPPMGGGGGGGTPPVGGGGGIPPTGGIVTPDGGGGMFGQGLWNDLSLSSWKMLWFIKSPFDYSLIIYYGYSSTANFDKI